MGRRPMGRRLSLLLTGLIAGGGLLSGCSRGDQSASGAVNLKEGVPVGAVLALSGNANVYGQDQRVGVNLALAAIISGGSISAMFGFFLCDGPVRNFEEAKAADTARFGRLHRAMLERGVYLAPSAFEAGFTSLAHSDDDIDATIAAFRECFAAVA